MDIQHPKLARLYDYWEQKRAGRRAPRRAEIDPTEIPELLAHMFICDVLRDPLDYRYVLSGTELTGAFGMDFRGKKFAEIFSGPSATEIRREYDKVVETWGPVVTTHDASWIDKEFLTYSRLLLPLSEDDKVVSKLFGAAFFDGAKAT